MADFELLGEAPAFSSSVLLALGNTTDTKSP